MDVLYKLYLGEPVGIVNPSIAYDLIRSGDYLNIEPLVIIGDHQWNDFVLESDFCHTKNQGQEHYPNVNIFMIQPGDAYEEFIYAVDHDYLSLVDYLLNIGVDPSRGRNMAIRRVSEAGYLDKC